MECFARLTRNRTDAIMAYETVQHNCAVQSETERFSNQVTIYQRAERLVQLSLNLLNVTQSSVFTLGTALIVLVSAYKISIGQQKVSEFVTLITYFAQLQAPLSFFGTCVYPPKTGFGMARLNSCIKLLHNASEQFDRG